MKRSICKVFGRTVLNTMALCLTVIALCFYACKQDTNQESKPFASNKTTASTSSQQPLPGGKAYFSVCFGHLATTGARWVRMRNMIFTESTGEVNATFWHWDSTLMKGKTAFNSHTCTMDNITKTCSTYVPTGWMIPSGHYLSQSGTYTYNTTTNTLVISWSGGTSETWTVSNPDANIARVVFVSSSGTGYAITHGRGYGSNMSFTGTAGVNYKTVSQIPRTTYSGYNVICQNVGGASTNIMTPATGWAANSLNLSTSTTAASPSPSNALHFWTQNGAPCGLPYTTRLGDVYHLASNNNGRSMSYTHWKACLCTTTNCTWPCYSLQLHPYAYQQIIDDTGAMRGFVGIEQQDEPPIPPATQNNDEYQLIDYTTVP